MKKVLSLLFIAICFSISAKDKVVDYSKIESWTKLEKYLVNSKGRKFSKLDLKVTNSSLLCLDVIGLMVNLTILTPISTSFHLSI